MVFDKKQVMIVLVLKNCCYIGINVKYINLITSSKPCMLVVCMTTEYFKLVEYIFLQMETFNA